MSDDVTIRVEELGKKYQIRHQAERQRYTALREVIADAAKKPLRWLAARRQKGPLSSDPVVSGQLSGSSAPSGQLSHSPVVSGPRTEDFWDLRDVSFSVRQGEVVGIIGRNGAGKSTLLKILSRITEPTTGRVHLKGRVASLLEVGTGFHPDLTGRKNIFLNGAVLGMHRAEIKRKFDEIVAFAVVAHLEPEILIVDEVLAVGDAQFQKKCLGKMQEVSRVAEPFSSSETT